MYWSAFVASESKQGKRTVSCKQRYSSTLGSSATSTPNTVNVVFRVVGIVIIEDMSNVLDIFNGISIQQMS